MKVRLRSYGIICVLTAFSAAQACDINQTLLHRDANAVASRIAGGITVSQAEIRQELRFASPSTTPLIWDDKAFSQWMTDIKPTVANVRTKFGHNRLVTFLNESEVFFKKADTTPLEKFAIFTLCQSVISKIMGMMDLYNEDVAEESIIPDEQLSLFVNTAHSTPRQSQASSRSTSTGLTINEESEGSDKSTSSTSHAGTTDDTKLSIVELDKSAFSKRSSVHYPKQLERAKYPIRISCDLRCVKMNQLDMITSIILEVDASRDLREVIFMNGSSMKFNALFPFLKNFTEKRRSETKPVIVVFSTTSDSQQAYKGLYTLGQTQPISKGAILRLGIENIRKESINEPQIIETDFSEGTLELVNSLLGAAN